jgi:hypothetical protein
MATDETLKTIERLLEDLYRDRDEVSRDEIFGRISGAQVSPDVRTYFAHLADGDYTLDELVDEINEGIQAEGRGEELGLTH